MLADHAKLNAWLDPGVDRFKGLGEEGDDRTAKQEDFRGKLVAFRNLYSFLGQIVPFADPDLEKLYAYGRMLLRKLPRPEGGEHWDPGEDVVLGSLRLKKEAEGDLHLKPGPGGTLPGPVDTGTGGTNAPIEKLSTIIEALNTRFGLDLPDHIENVLDGVADDLAQSEKIQLAAKANDKGNFGHVFIPAFKDALVDHHAENGTFVDLVFKDDRLMHALNALMLDRVYERLRPSDDATAAREGAQQ